MKYLTSPLVILLIVLAAVTLLYGLSTSPNTWLWAACLLALPAMMWLAGAGKGTPALLFILGISWLQITANVAVADLYGIEVADIGTRVPGAIIVSGPKVSTAIYYSLCAMLAGAFGMRVGERIGRTLFRDRPVSARLGQLSVKNVVLGYTVTSIVLSFIGRFAYEVPGLFQGFIGLSFLKFAFIFVIAMIVIETRRGYAWLIAILLLEIASGMIGFFSSYKEAIYIMLIAVASSRRRLGGRDWMIAAGAAVCVVWISLIWSVIKQEVRTAMPFLDTQQKIEFIFNKYTGSDIDYRVALLTLLQRIEYTSLYGKVIQLDEAGFLPRDRDYYAGAILHILTPRLLFPDKLALDDSQKTTDLIGISIAEGTSIGVGYVAEAHADFGFPWLLVPISLIGLLLGVIARYFTTRPVPSVIRQAFAAATLFLSFRFEANIDKNLGGLMVASIVMAVCLKFGYPRIAHWLAGLRRNATVSVDVYGRNPSR